MWQDLGRKNRSVQVIKETLSCYIKKSPSINEIPMELQRNYPGTGAARGGLGGPVPPFLKVHNFPKLFHKDKTLKKLILKRSTQV